MKILLVEDDESLITVLTHSLTAQHHIVDAVHDGEMGWNYGSTFEYDLIVLDIMLPKMDGIALCQRFRAEGYTIPILLLTSQDLTTAKVRGFDAGADDYVVKPFELPELIARIRALLRRGSTNPLPLLTWGELYLNPGTCEVTYSDRPLALTTKEYDLLELLLRNSHHVFSSEEILDRLWSSDDFPSEATVRSHLRRLRQKLQQVGAPHDFISTIHGRGYYLKSPLSTAEKDRNGKVFGLSQSDRQSSPDLNTVRIDPPNPPILGDFEQSSSQELQYLAFLNQTWTVTKPQCLERFGLLATTCSRLQAGICSYPEQQQAYQLAHKLVGTLGLFSLTIWMQMTRQLEYLLDRPTILPPEIATLAQNLVENITQAIQTTDRIQTTHSIGQNAPLLLVVNPHPIFTNSLTTTGQEQGFQTMMIPTYQSACNYLTTALVDLTTPAVILFWLPVTEHSPDLPPALVECLHIVKQRFAHWSVAILGERDQLRDRLAVVRHGVKFFSTNTLTPAQIVTAAVSLIQPSISTIKVMILDDDADWLYALPQLLKPWGFKLTTLADPLEFWTVLQTVRPDVLILDVNIPEINGFELCQVIRSDPQWQRLPVLFLSVLNDDAIASQAFSVGADDYLCKPIMGGKLAQRILYRLARLEAYR